MTTLAVVGGGGMGSQIAQQAALHGVEVVLQDVSAGQLGKAVEQNRQLLQRRVDKGRLSQAEAEAAVARVRTTTDLGEAARVGIVIEAIVEQLEPKREIFAELDRICPADTILASNSSTMPISTIASATGRPDRCCNLHFFFPVLVMELCEVVRGPQTSEATIGRAMDFVREMGRVPVLINKEIDGFIVNRILHHASQEAYRLFDAGVAGFEDIDIAVEKGLNWPLGPFRLGDLSGLDVTYNARRHIFETTGDPKYKPSEQLRRKVEEGKLGRKTGEGWYKY
ncbi:MAG TPA: 3-hydroxyacyl-CoA dehydrogenase family protein [Candidatus Dormibacteraeota bacterium]